MQTFEEICESLNGASKMFSEMSTSAAGACNALAKFGSAARDAFEVTNQPRLAIISRKSRRKTWRKYHG